MKRAKIIYHTNTIWVKPYVKAYFTQHPLDNWLKKLLKILLKSDDTSEDDVYVANPKGHVEWKIEIPERWFNEGHHTLTLSNARLLSGFMEEYIKSIFEQAVKGLVLASNYAPLTIEVEKYLEALRDEDLGLDENAMSIELLQKHIYRYCRRENISFREVKKISRVVRADTEECPRFLAPKGTLFLEQWLHTSGVSRTTFYKHLFASLPVSYHNGRLCVPTLN